MAGWVAPAVGALGGIIGANKQAGAAKDAKRQLDSLTDEWRQMNMPDLSPIEFERFKDIFVPQMAQDSLMGDIQTDPRLQDAQMAALGQLGELSEGGLNLQDKADLADIQGEVARQDAGRQAAIMQGMAERGMGGAGMELAQRLQSQSAGADRAAGNARNVAAQAQQRALDAIMRRGQLGGEMRSQQFGEDSAKARAQDAMNLYNTGLLNEGQRNRQNISNMNTDITNTERQQPNQINQQQFNNQVQKQTGISDLGKSSAVARMGQGAAEAAMFGGLGSGISQGAGSYMSNKEKK